MHTDGERGEGEFRGKYVHACKGRKLKEERIQT